MAGGKKNSSGPETGFGYTGGQQILGATEDEYVGPFDGYFGLSHDVETIQGHVDAFNISNGELGNAKIGPASFSLSRYEDENTGQVTYSVSGTVFGYGSRVDVVRDQNTKTTDFSGHFVEDPNLGLGLGAQFGGIGLSYDATFGINDQGLVLDEHVIFGRGHKQWHGVYSVTDDEAVSLPFSGDIGSVQRLNSLSFGNEQFAISLNLRPGILDQLPTDPRAAIEFLGGILEATETGATHRDDGSVDFWSNGTVVGRTNAKSNYSDDFLDNYGTVDTDGYASVGIGGHVRGLGDWLGFDGTFGLDGGFSKPGEGKQPDTTPDSGLPSKPDGNSGGSDLAPISSPRPRAREDRDNDNGGGGSSSGSSGGNSGRSGHNSGTGMSGEDRPIILDLDGSGIELTELSNSTVFVDSSGDGLQNLTAWAAAGNGVLFYDADGDGTISETREYVFTEWDPTATSDIEALRSVFDTNSDGVFDANDDAWSDFKVLVTQPDGSLVAKTLDELGITSIDLTADATNIELPDGSVITGTTTFTWSDGSTGTVADTLLVSDTASYRIEESEDIDAHGVRMHIQTGYGADGAISFVITSVTTADGASITNSYDKNGDGVVDRMQTIETVTNSDGSKSETVTNKVGSDFTTGILVSETRTTTSADGHTVTIERDSTGGGWYDQVEVRTTHVDDSMTIVTTDRDPNGGVIRSSTETVSADGLTRTDAIDEDGDGLVDLTITHSIVINGDGSRSETIEHFNQDGSLRSSVTESVSVDGRTKSIARDLDGDGAIDTQEELSITVNADGSTNSTLTVKNGDGSVRSASTHSQSDDALTKSSAMDQDGDGDVDLTTIEATVIHADGSRETETTLTNTDASVRAKTKVTLGSDQVSSETWVDHNQDGIFQATDLSRSVTVDNTSGERTTTSWTRNADGSFSAQSVSVSSEDGLVVTTDVDADGDGDTDLSTSDVTVENTDGSSTRTITERAQDGALKGEQVVTTSADGLIVTTTSDVNGDSSKDGKSVLTQVSNGDGSTLQTTTRHAGDETTLLGETTVSQSADRRLTITTSDANGDGATDTTLRSEKHADGSMTKLETRFSADGATLSTRQTDVSANGLTVTTAVDLDGDGDTDTTSVQATTLNADGGHTTTSTIHNGDDSLRSQMVTTVSDDGLVTTTSEDTDGDGVSERSVTATTVLNADGLRTTTEDVQASDDSLLSRSETLVSDDGLTVETRADNDGDFSADIVTTRVTTLNDDGSTTVTAEVRDVTGASDELRSQGVTTTSDDGRDVFETTDINGDGQVDMRVHRVVGDDGHVTVTQTELNSDGSLQSRITTETSDTGLENTTRYDADGDGAYERSMDSTTVLSADGSTMRTVEEKAEDGSVYRRTITETSRDGWTTTTREDRDTDGDDDLTTTQVYDLSSAGVETTTVTRSAADSSTLSTETSTVSADKRNTTRTVDVDGNGQADQVVTTSISDDGRQTREDNFYDDSGNLLLVSATAVSSDGLTTTSRTDRNADGMDELVTTSITTLGADGGRTNSASYTDGIGTQFAKTTSTQSDDGLSSVWSADFDGDDTFEFVTTDATTYQADGVVVGTTTTTDGDGTLLSSVVSTTSGNGLITSTQTDIDEDGTTDQTISRTVEANGAWSQTTQQFDASGALVQAATVSESADGWTRSRSVDTDGDGNADRNSATTIDVDRTSVSTWRDLNTDGSASHVIRGSENANGAEASYAFDLDGDGLVEFERETDVSFDGAGNRITQFTEMHGARLNFSETVTTSANGLSQTVTTDIDGDGDTDVTRQSATTLHNDGRQTLNVTASYVDGSTKSTLVRDTSADGRTVTETRDYDGDGLKDLDVTTTTGADGRYSRVEKTYDTEGDLTNTRTTTVSADGLITTINTDDTKFSVTGSPIGNGTYETSYSGEKQSFTSSHQVDGAGFVTWVLSQTKDGTTTQYEARLTADMKARVIAEGERLYDTLLDRDMDRSEAEALVARVRNGELDIEGLAGDLLQSDEYTMRYADKSDASFVNQTYLNTLGRGPSLDELEEALTGLSGGSLNRAELAAELSEGLEHIVVGNGHMSSNNFDVFLNPAQAERTTDKAYISSLAEKLVGVFYDTKLSGIALDLLVERAHNGTEDILTLATRLASETADVDPDVAVDLAGMSDADFATHVLRNAFGTEPSAADVTLWSGYLATDQLSRGEFALVIVRSTEYAATGSLPQSSASIVEIDASDPQNYTVGQQAIDGVTGDDRNNTIDGSASSRSLELSGGAGNDILSGGSAADFLYGGAGADTLNGNAGNDYLFIDAADLTSGNVQGGAGFDTVKVLDSTAINLVMVNHSVEAAFGGTGADTISGAGHTYGILISGGAGNDSVTGGNGGDYLYGDAGADNVVGWYGDDFLYGGFGDDSLYGGAGNDSHFGGTGDDYVFGSSGNDILNGGAGADELRGGTGNDAHYGEAGDDWLLGWTGDDILDGGDGNDELEGGTGADTLIGGAGTDRAFYYNSGAAVFINLDAGTASGGEAAGDTLTGIEELTGSWHNDHLTGDEQDNYLFGNNGHDILRGGGGDDEVRGGAGNDQHYGDAGNDWLHGWTGDDLLDGGDGNDNLEGGAGADTLIGGAGIDRAFYTGSGASVTINLATGAASGGDAAGDTLTGVEELTGSAHNDHLTGDA
ncbi:DUF4214 domain-containing protein [uncultured Ruegeria sp.]|uniref:DUF4214 domain-containing protein n=1 Tax=uncultured Ruegeria sp. TaxID=259304 RepID=UPI002618DE5B|nr:DUF4214 domain-containing protein [uncultured Ruegeria sp.]